jgi:hypothetical protein
MGNSHKHLKINNMKQIEPLSIWINGNEEIAQYLQVTCTYDNNESLATEFYQLFTMFVDGDGIETPAEQIAQGSLSISGQSYIDWGNEPAMSVNAWIYEWVAVQINVTII